MKVPVDLEGEKRIKQSNFRRVCTSDSEHNPTKQCTESNCIRLYNFRQVCAENEILDNQKK